MGVGHLFSEGLMIIDLTNAHEDVSGLTTRYVGRIVVNGLQKKLDDHWLGFVASMITEKWPELDYESTFDAVYVELGIGHRYEASLKDGELVFTELASPCFVVRPSIN
jgi:hypothetical protein